MKGALLVLAILSNFAHAQGSPPVSSRFRLEGATAVDQQTGLRWQRCSVGQVFQANNSCQGNPKKVNFMQAQKVSNFTVQRGGFWRVPTKNELASLVDSTNEKIEIDTLVVPDASVKNRFYWSCDLYADGAAWYADFVSGDVGFVSGDHASADDLLAVRLVHVEW